MMRVVEVIPNDNEKEREDSRGRVHVSHRRTWLVVTDGYVLTETRTKREAVEKAAMERAR